MQAIHQLACTIFQQYINCVLIIVIAYFFFRAGQIRYLTYLLLLCFLLSFSAIASVYHIPVMIFFTTPFSTLFF